MESNFEWSKWLREKWAKFNGDYENIKDIDASLDAVKVRSIALARIDMRKQEAEERESEQTNVKKIISELTHSPNPFHSLSTTPKTMEFKWLSPKKTLTLTNILKTITLDGQPIDLKNSTVTPDTEKASYKLQTVTGVYLKIDALGVIPMISATKLENNVTITLKSDNDGKFTTPQYNKELTNKISSYIQTLPVGTLGIWVDKNGFIKLTQWGNTVQMITNSEQVKIEWDSFIIRSSDWSQEKFNKKINKWERNP